MLSKNEEEYIEKIPEDKIVVIKPYTSLQAEIANEIMSKIKSAHPDIDVKNMGASGLAISGQGDLDIYALTDSENFSKYLPAFISLFGEPKSKHEDSVAWEMVVDTYPVELYLTDPESESMKRQIAVFDALRSNDDLRLEYEKLKSDMDGKSFKEYQRRKYEFYHKLLGQEYD